MANQQGNGRNMATPDENRTGWRPQDDNGVRGRRDDDDRYMSHDRDDDRYMQRGVDDRGSRWDRDEGYRSTERYGQGQSGYGSGRYEDDRSYESRGTGYPRGMDERPRERGLDDRFSQGRGGSRWGERHDRSGNERQIGGGGYGHGEYRGGYPSQPSERYSAQRFGDEEWGNEGFASGMDAGDQRGYGAQGSWRQQGHQGDWQGGGRDWRGGRALGVSRDQSWQGGRDWQGGPGEGFRGQQGGQSWQGSQVGRDWQGGQGQGNWHGMHGSQGNWGPGTSAGYGGSGTQGMYGQQAPQFGGHGAQGQGGLYGQGGYNEGMYGQGGMQHRYGSQGYQGYGMQGDQGFGPRGQHGFGQQVEGYGQQGISHRGKGPSGYTRSDERIREMVCEALSDDHNVDATNIEVTVKNGEVVLSGTIEDRNQKRMAEDIAERISGVKDVQNQIRVAADRKASGKEARDTSSTSGDKSESTTATDKRHRA